MDVRSALLASAHEAERRVLGTSDPDEGIVYAILALRRTVEAALEPSESVAEAEPGCWCRVELFGHSVVHGLVRDVERYGRRWLEVVEPAISADPGDRSETAWPERTKLYHPNSVYALEERAEESVVAAHRLAQGYSAAGRRLHLEDDVPF